MALWNLSNENKQTKSQTDRNRIEEWFPGTWRNKDKLVNEYKLMSINWVRPEELLYSMVIVVDNTVFVKWVGVKCSPPTKKKDKN